MKKITNIGLCKSFIKKELYLSYSREMETGLIQKYYSYMYNQSGKL